MITKNAGGAWDAFREMVRYGNPASWSGLEVGAKVLETGIWGAYKNVTINMADIRDEGVKEEICRKADRLFQRAAKKCSKVFDIFDRR